MKERGAQFVVPVIDLFAGPGGLSEGFERYRIGHRTVFKSVLSIEKERYAHQTLLLRAFFRQFRKPPLKYYEHLRGKVTLDQLYRAYPKQYKRAAKQAIRLALRFKNRQRIDGLIRSALAQRHLASVAARVFRPHQSLRR